MWDMIKKDMGKWKTFPLILIVITVIVVTAGIVYGLLRPEPSEIERVFDGTEAVFVEGNGLLKNWHILTETDYLRSGTHRGLLELPPVRDMIDAIRAGGDNWIDRVNADAVMSAVGDESALGLYVRDGSLRLLFVSRVDPDFLLMDRLLAFAGADTGITVTPYRTMRVKEAALDKGRSLRWALDGDFLILSDDRDIFYAAVDRRVSGETGMIAANRDFARMKRHTQPSRLISGYAVTERLSAIPEMRRVFSGAGRALIPESFRFSLSYADGLISLDAQPAGGIAPFWLLSGRKKETPPPLGVGEIAAAWVGRMPLGPWDTAGSFLPTPPLPTLLPRLFPNGFSMLVLSDPRGAGGPGMIAVGERSASFTEAVARLTEASGLAENSATIAGVSLLTLSEAGVPYLAWTERGDRILVSGRTDLLASVPLETLETGSVYGYNSPDGRIIVTIRPRLIYRELENSAEPIPFADLSLDEQRRLSAALYPAESIDSFASVAGNGLRFTIGIHVEDVIP